MKLVITAVKDELTGYLDLQCDQSLEIAKRKFDYAINSQDSIISANAKHFSLFKLGEYDTETGDITTDKTLIIEASSLLREKNV